MGYPNVWSWCLRLLMLATTTSSPMPNILLGPGDSKVPDHLGGINHECWGSASLEVIEVRKLRVAEGVDGLWDFMTYLRASLLPKHQELFMDLAQVLWQRYVDCVLSRAHGLGKRRSQSAAKIYYAMIK